MSTMNMNFHRIILIIKEDINEIFRLTQYYVYLSKAENALRCLDDIEENIQQE